MKNAKNAKKLMKIMMMTLNSCLRELCDKEWANRWVVQVRHEKSRRMVQHDCSLSLYTFCHASTHSHTHTHNSLSLSLSLSHTHTEHIQCVLHTNSCISPAAGSVPLLEFLLLPVIRKL